MYFNEAADVIKSTASMKSGDDFDKAKKEYEGLFKNAEPYLEKAMDLNPKKSEADKNLLHDTLTSLKQLYARLGETDKYNKVKAMLE